jgi:riboflavin transporter FmnP
MVRSIGAVAAGYLIFAMSAVLLFQMSGRAPHQAQPLGFEIASIIWGCVFALVAGWLTARIAARKQTIHAAALAGVIALGALASLIGDVSGAKWSQIAALVVMAPCAWIGGLVSRARR